MELRERDLPGLFSERIVTEEGTTGLLLIQGSFDRRLYPGEHILEGGIGAVLGGALAEIATKGKQQAGQGTS